MNSIYQPINLEELSEADLVQICYDLAGQLVIPTTEDSLNTANTSTAIISRSVRTLNGLEQAHLDWVFYWLKRYQPEPNFSNLEQVKGYLEAFYHLCQLAAWKTAYQLLCLPVDEQAKIPLHEQLGNWGYYQKQIDLYQKILYKVNAQVDCICLHGMGRAFRYLGQFDKSLQYHQEQLKLAIQNNNSYAETLALGGLGRVYLYLSQYKQASFYHNKQLKLAQNHNYGLLKAYAIRGLGCIYLMINQNKKAELHLKKSCQISFQHRDTKGEIVGLIKLAENYAFSNQSHKSIELLEQRYLKLKDEANCYDKLMLLECMSKQYTFAKSTKKAILFSEKVLTIAKQHGNTVAEIRMLNQLGLIYFSQLKQYKRAINYLELSYQKAQRIGLPVYYISIPLSNLAYCYSVLNQKQLAVETAQKAVKFACNTQNPQAISIAKAGIATVYWYQGKHCKGLYYAAQALVILPPWKSANGWLIWETTVTFVSRKIKTMFGSLCQLNFLYYN